MPRFVVQPNPNMGPLAQHPRMATLQEEYKT